MADWRDKHEKDFGLETLCFRKKKIGAKSLTEIVGRMTRDQPLDRTSGKCLLLVSSDVKNSQVLLEAARPEIVARLYDFDTSDCDDLLELAQQEKSSFTSIGFFCNGQPGSVELTSSVTLTLQTVDKSDIKSFWSAMADLLEEDGRIDIMAGPVGASRDGHNLLRKLEALTAKDFTATSDAADLDAGDMFLETGNVNLAELYFYGGKVKAWQGLA